MKTISNTNSEEVFYPLPSVENSPNPENNMFFTIIEVAALIFDHVPSSELGKVARVSKTFYSIIYTVPRLRLTLFLERAKQAAAFINAGYDQESTLQDIVKIEVYVNIHQAKMTLEKITRHSSRFFRQGALNVVKKEVEFGQLEQAEVTAQTIARPYYQFLAWLEIVKKQKADKNFEKTIEIIEMIKKDNFDRCMAYLKLWNIDRNNVYLLKIKELLKQLGATQKLWILEKMSKFEPSLKNIQRTKKHITLLSEPPPTLKKIKIKRLLDVAITIWKINHDENFLKKIKTKTNQIKSISTKFHTWRNIYKAAPEKEHLEQLISLIPLISCCFKQAKTWILLFKFTKDGIYLKNASDAIDRSAYLHHKNLIWLRIVKAKAEAGQIQEAKEDAKKIQNDSSLTTMAWIAIWKGEKTMEHLREAISRIGAANKSEQASLWVELAKASMGP